MTEVEKIREHRSNGDNDDDEQRIRDRLRAKLESRKDSSDRHAQGSRSERNESAIKENDDSRRQPSNDEKTGDVGAGSRRRRRRHRGKRARVGGGPPPSFPPHPIPPFRRGSHSPAGRPPPPPGGPYGPGPAYGPPPGPYGGGRGYHPPYGGPPPYGYDWRGPRPPPHGGRYAGDGMIDDFGRRLPPRRSRSPNGEGNSYNRGRSSSYSRSRSRSNDRRRRRSRSRSVSSSVSTSSESLSSSASSQSSRTSKSSRSSRDRSSSDSCRSYSDEESQSTKGSVPQDGYTKDQRTVFITQLIRRTTEKDIAKFFRKQGLKTNEIILLRDKRTGQHKGSAYVEMRRMEDVVKSLGLSGKPPDFQRFPILIKASEAEKNYSLANKNTAAGGSVGTGVLVPAMANPVGPSIKPPLVGPNGKVIQAQKLYVGNLDPSVLQEHLFALFNPFGQLEQVTLQKNEAGISRGFAFLQFRDPKEANLALQTMSGRMLAGRPMKTGWANQVSANPSVDVVISQEFPDDSTNRAQTAYMVLAQLLTSVTASAPTGTMAETLMVAQQQSEPSSGGGMSRVPTVAEARASLAAHGSARAGAVTQFIPGILSSSVVETANIVAPDPSKIGNADNPTKNVLVHNMFNKDTETEQGWENDIREEFQEECSKYGKIMSVIVMHTEPGGKIYATFDSIAGAQNCASNLAGRWFDKRQLRVEFVPDALVPASSA